MPDPPIIPSSRVQISEPNTGIVSNTWFRWFNAVQFLFNTPKIRAYRSTDYTMPGLVDQVLPMDTIEYNNAGEYNTSLGQWTPSVSGVYLVSAGAYLTTHQTSATLIRLMIFENGTRIRYFFNDEPPSTSLLMAGSDIITVTAGKFYEVRVTVNTASSQFFGGSTGTWFSAAYQP